MAFKSQAVCDWWPNASEETTFQMIETRLYPLRLQTLALLQSLVESQS